MPATAIVDPHPADYRSAPPAAVYLAPAVLAQCGATAGDLVRVSLRDRRLVGRVAGPLEAAAGGTVRFDRFARQTLKAFPHDEVAVERIELPGLEELVLLPTVDLSLRRDPELVARLRERLCRAAVPVCEGMLLYLRSQGGPTGLAYEVHSASNPEGVCTAATRVYVEFAHDHEHGAGAHSHAGGATAARTTLDTTYEDVGGLSVQIRAVREYVELPLVFPQVYRQLGIAPPHGVIFHGAPGTGKTLLARAIASEVHARFFYVNGPEVVGTYGGQTEENLRRLFSDAAYEPPAIIFVDEVDAIAPVRGTAGTLSDTRAVTQLLALMDGLRQAEGVMVIGTTNRIEAIEPALRRAGRFDREVYFPTPEAAAREHILRIHTREMPLSEDALAALPEIARRAHGFVGADLMELSREAALAALRRAAGDFLDQPSLGTYPAAAGLSVGRTDFEEALSRAHPAALRETLATVPEAGWEDVGGLHAVKERLRRLVARPLADPAAWRRAGLSGVPGVLLYGPPGNGKTLLARAVAAATGANFIALQGPELFSQWLGESERGLREVFATARRAAPCIVFFDQLDALAPRRSTGPEAVAGDSLAPQRVLGQLLAEIDGMEPLTRVLVLGAVADLARVDHAILRPGRFGFHLFVGPPDESERADILRVHLRDAPLDPPIDRARLTARLAAETAGFTGADLAFLCQEAKLAALDDAGLAGDVRLTAEHLTNALADLRRIVAGRAQAGRPGT